jgi:hypothetical protein
MKKIIKALKWAFALVVGILGVILLGKPRDLHEAELKAIKEEEENLKKDLVRQCNTAEELENKYEEWLAKWHDD